MTKRGKTVLLCAALLFLVALMAAVNLPGSPLGDRRTPSGSGSAGSAVGEILPDFTVTLTDGSRFTLSEQTQAGRTVVLNIWATWCAPCVKELPYFDRLARERGDVSVLALHSDLVTEDVEAFLAGLDCPSLPFAVDPDGEVTALLGGDAVLPRTVVVSPEGIVLYNAAGSVTYEQLTELADRSGSGSPSPVG